MSRNIKFSVGEFYHIYNRGTDKRDIFLSDKDYKRFVALLHIINNFDSVNVRDISLGLTSGIFELPVKERIVDIGAYCLMPNHFHFLVREKEENGISLFMQKISTAYTMFFNKKYDRTGALFAGTFKAQHANFDQYLKYLISYIHLNPIKIIDLAWKEKGISDKEKAKKYLETYPHSSYLDYLYPGKRREAIILNISTFPEYFSTIADFSSAVDEWLSFGASPEVKPREPLPRFNLGENLGEKK